MTAEDFSRLLDEYRDAVLIANWTAEKAGADFEKLRPLSVPCKEANIGHLRLSRRRVRPARILVSRHAPKFLSGA
jgi:hypothetical protein